MIVIITVTTELSAGGGGDGESLVGIIPAKAVPDRAHASATAITNRFILFSPFLGSEDARLLTTKPEYCTC